MNITFICTGNTCRSAMAEGICKKMLSDRNITEISCRSCGLAAFTGDSASPNAIEAAKTYGADISAHRAVTANQYILDETDIAVCMTERHKAVLISAGVKCRILVPDNGISDPYGGNLDVYKKCASELADYIERLLDVLTVKIVPMAENHISQIAELERQCFNAPWEENALREELENENAHFLAAISNDKVLGYIGVHEICVEAYIDNIAVFSQYRRFGIGERLITTAADSAESRKCEFISLEVRKSNASAIALYEKQGYNVAGERKNFYREPVENALIMTKYFKDCETQ